MGLVNTTTNLSYARNELIKVGVSFIFDKVADMIYYMAANDDIGTTTTAIQSITRTDPTTAENGLYVLMDLGGAWTAGNMVALRGKASISGSGNYVSATGVWAGLDFATATGSGSGLTCAINAEVSSNNSTVPNAILYLQSLPSTSNASFAGVPFIVFSETRASSATGSGILFECGHAPAGTTVTTGSSGIFNTTTLRIKVNGTIKYIPLSTATNTLTTAGNAVLTGTLTVGANGTGEDVIFYGDTSGANLTWDADTDSLEFTNSFMSMGTMDIGVPTTDTIKHTLEVHTEPAAGLSSSGLNAGIRSRYHITGAQTNQITFVALEGRMRIKSDMADGVIAAVCGTIETDAMDFTGTSTTIRAAGVFSLDFATGTTITSGWLCGVAIDSAMHSAVDLASCTCAGLRISVGGSKEPWTHGIYISDAVTGITITGPTSVGINCSATALDAEAGRIGKFVGGVVDADQGDGYGVFEVQANFSGTIPSGTTANASSFWINFSGSTVVAGTLICVQNNGIWMPTSITTSTTNMCIGMRMHYEDADNAQPAQLFCFSINPVGGTYLTSIFEGSTAAYGATSTKSGGGIAVPFLNAQGTVYYVNVYSS